MGSGVAGDSEIVEMWQSGRQRQNVEDFVKMLSIFVMQMGKELTITNRGSKGVSSEIEYVRE